MAHQPHQWHPGPSLQYGGPGFQYQPQLPNNGQQQFQYSPSAPSPSIRQQYVYPPPVNQSRFDANSQIPSPNNVAAQYPSAAFNPALFHQFANSNLPPPPPPSFPPLPLPNATFPQFMSPPQMSNNNFQNQYSPHGHSTMPSMQQQQQHRMVGQHNYNARHGALSRQAMYQEMDTGDQEPRAAATGLFPTRDQISRQENNDMITPMLRHQDSDVAAPASSEGTDSVSSYHPPSATPPESGQTLTTSGHAAPTTDVGEPSKYQGRGLFEMRELAKGALLSLAPHNIKFSDLLAEGINAQLLSQLFEEVGLKTTQNPASQPSVTNGFLNPSPTAQSKPAATPTAPAQPQIAIDQPAPEQVSASPVSIALPIKPHAKPAFVTLASTEITDVASSASPIMERKDRIAAMLAAKTGKVIIRKESPVSTPIIPPSATTSSIPTPQPQSMPSGIITTAVQPTEADATSKAVLKSKSKAQTELVRQKMEQLKRESLAKAPAQQASQKTSSPSTSGAPSALTSGLSTYPQTGLPPKPVLEEAFVRNGQLLSSTSSAISRTMSGSVPLHSTTFASSIPGLFMMDAEPDPALAVSVLEDSVFPSATIMTASADELAASNELSRGTQLEQSAPLGGQSRESSSTRLRSKRPLAADTFDEQDMPPAKQQISRPTSSLGEESAMNDGGSDDFSEGEIMEIDDGSPVSPLPKISGARAFAPGVNTNALWTDARPPFQSVSQQGTTGSSGSMAPGFRSTINGPGISSSSNLDLKLEIARKELREAEDRRKAKQLVPQLQSPASSPVNSPRVHGILSPVSMSASNAVPVGSLKEQRSANTAENIAVHSLASSDLKPQVQFPVKDSVQRAKDLKEKILRQRMLKQGLPVLDKEVQNTQNRQAEAQAKLAHLRREAEKREKEAREARQREQEIMEEMKILEQQLEIGVNGQQQFSQEMETLDQEMMPPVVSTSEDQSEIKRTLSSPRIILPRPADEFINESAHPAPQLDENNEKAHENENIDSGESIMESDEEPLRTEHNNRHVRPSAEAALPTAEEEAAFLEPATMDESTSDYEGLPSSEENSQHPYADESPGEDNPSDLDESPMEVDSDSDGSASMSDSGSEDYQPAEPMMSQDKFETADDDEGEYDPMDAPLSRADSLLLDQEEADYEPSEVVEEVRVDAAPVSVSVDQTGSPLSDVDGSENEPEHGDDREHGVELTEANTLTTSQEVLPSVRNTADIDAISRASGPSSSRFTPYQSALSNFKSFRFNSEFTERVPDGYRSLTYSNTIDPSKPLCVTEAEGGVCNDVKCKEQHFRQMSLADEKILVQMSSANDIPDKAQRDRFVAGLKLVIADLRTKQISDFDTVASELAAYRRRFRQEQDPSLAFTSDEL